jgi:thymidylate kinase
MIITIIGVDGVGKTTLAKNLSNKIENSIYKYAGYNPENRKYFILNDFIKKAKKSLLQRVLIRLLIILNDLIEFNYQKKSRIKIYDRYIYDNIIQNYKTDRQTFYKRLSKIFPKPDLLILLSGDENIIFNRKKELTPQIIKEQTLEYKKIFKELNIEYIEFDTTKLNEKELLKEVLNLI